MGLVWSRRRQPSLPTTATIFRSFLLGAVVFVVAALAGAVLSTAAPAGTLDAALPLGQAPPNAATQPPGDLPEGAPGGQAHRPGTAVDPIFARSMVYSGTAALALSVAGLVMIGRRRRHW